MVVHQVIVQKGVVVVCLQRTSLHEYALRIVFVEIVRQEHQHRADALAAYGKYILDRSVDALRLAVIAQVSDEVVNLAEQFV